MLNDRVRKIKRVYGYTAPDAIEEGKTEAPPTSGEATNAQASDTEPTMEPMIEANESEHEPPPPPEPKSEEIDSQAKKPKNKIIDMPTTPKSSSKSNARRVGGKCQQRSSSTVTRSTVQKGRGRNSQRLFQSLNWK